MKISDINPHIRYAEKQLLLPAEFTSTARDSRLLYLEEGNLTFLCGGKIRGNHSYTTFPGELGDCYLYSENVLSDKELKNYDKIELEAGSLLLWHPGIRYRFLIENLPRILIFNFDYTQNHASITSSLHVCCADNFDISQMTERVVFEDFPEFNEDCFIYRNARRFETDLLRIISEIKDGKPFAAETASAILKQVLCGIVRDSRTVTHTSAADRVIDYIHRNYCQPITNRDIAESVNYHEFYVNRLIRESTGMTLHQFLNTYRVQQAAKLLVSTEYPIARIATLCGFHSAAYFISAFKSQMGETPSEYRRRRIGLV